MICLLKVACKISTQEHIERKGQTNQTIPQTRYDGKMDIKQDVNPLLEGVTTPIIKLVHSQNAVEILIKIESKPNNYKYNI